MLFCEAYGTVSSYLQKYKDLTLKQGYVMIFMGFYEVSLPCAGRHKIDSTGDIV